MACRNPETELGAGRSAFCSFLSWQVQLVMVGGKNSEEVSLHIPSILHLYLAPNGMISSLNTEEGGWWWWGAARWRHLT